MYDESYINIIKRSLLDALDKAEKIITDELETFISEGAHSRRCREGLSYIRIVRKIVRMANTSEQRFSNVGERAIAETFEESFTPNKVESSEPESLPEFLKASRVAKIFGVTPSALIGWHKQGTLTPIKVNGRNYYRREDVNKLLEPQGIRVERND